MEVIYIKGTAFSFSIRMTILKYIKMTQHLDPNGPPDINVVQCLRKVMRFSRSRFRNH